MLNSGDPTMVACSLALSGGALQINSEEAHAGGEDMAHAGGEDMMQDFVRLHMMSILQPFAERVQELQDHMDGMAEELGAVQGACEEHVSRLDQQQLRLSDLDTGAVQARENLDRVQADFQQLRREKARLDGNHEMTKASVTKTRENLDQLAASLEALQQVVQANGTRVGALEAAVPELETKLIGHVDTRLDKQGRVCKDLNDRTAELQKSCQQLKALGDSAHAAIRKLSDSHGARLQDDAENLRDLNATTGDLQARLLDVEQSVLAHSETFKVADREIQHLKTWSGQMADVQKWRIIQSEATDSLQERMKQLDQVEADLMQARNDAISERQLQSAEFGKLEKTVGQNISDVLKWRDSQKAQSELIASAGTRLFDLESGQSNLSMRADSAEQELRHLSSWRQTATGTLGDHDTALGAARADLSRAHGRIEAADAGIQGLRKDFGTEREAVAKIRSRLDLCCQYFNGLGKGLADTSKQMASGEGGLLPSKSNGSMLPAIPKAGRTPRVASISPRRR